MPLKQIAKLQILAKQIEALVPPEPLQLGGVNAAVHPVVSAPRLRLWPPRSCRPKPAAMARV
jgi:hypothetical protein